MPSKFDRISVSHVDFRANEDAIFCSYAKKKVVE
jgi:hypothetical protein